MRTRTKPIHAAKAKDDTQKIIAMSAPVSITAGDASGEEKGPAKFESTFYTGGELEVKGYDLPVVVDLAGLETGNVLVANLDHDSSKRVGNFKVTNDGKSLVAHGEATAVNAASEEVVRSAARGYQWQSSLEVMPKPKQTEFVKAGRIFNVNGQTFTGPKYIARKGVLKGFAFVSHGADDNTSVNIAAGAASHKESDMDEELKAFIEAMLPGTDVTTLSDQAVANLKADFEGKPGARKKIAAGATTTIKAGSSIDRELLEVDRQEEIEAITNGFIDGTPRQIKTREYLNSLDAIKTKAIDGEWTPKDYEHELLKATLPLQRTASAPRNRDKLNDDIIQAAICQAGNLKNLDDHFSDEVLQAAKDRFKEGIGLNQILCIAAADRGYHCDNYRANLEVQRAAFGMLGGPIHASTGFSTLSLPGIFSDSAHKFLLEGWGGGETTWEDVADIISVRDFRQISQYKLSGNLKYEKVGPGGEIKHGTVSEDTYNIKADTYGKMFAITREHIINDDLNALTGIPRELGYGANDAFNEVFWTAWLAGDGSFFASGNANVSTGVMSSTAAIATIAAAEAIFFAQTKPNGTPLGKTPNVMLMPNGTFRVAQAAMASPLVVGGSSTVPNANVFASEYKVVRSAFLSNTAISGYSAVKWYLLCVRPGFAAIQAAFLNGQKAPTIEPASAAFDTLGIQLRGVHDFGVSLFEKRAGVQGSGA